MCYFVVFQPSKVEMLIFSASILINLTHFPNDSKSLPEVCYINLKNPENLSRVGALGRRYLCYQIRAKICRLGMVGQESIRQSLKSQEDKAFFTR